MRTRWHAAWVLPIGAPPIRDGWVAARGGRIVAVGGPADRAPLEPDEVEIDLGEAAVLPGLINAHTHLELSYLRDAVQGNGSFVGWIRALMAARRAGPDAAASEVVGAVHAAIAEAVRCGTAAVGDISNTLVSFAPLEESPLGGVVFYELIGFNPADPQALVERACAAVRALPGRGRLRACLAAHAPYSVSPAVLQAIATVASADPHARCSVHLAESIEEVEFVRTGGGPWRALLEELGVWNPTWTPPGVSPAEYLFAHRFLGPQVIAVHGVHLGWRDLARLAEQRATLVACPRSNARTGAGTPPIDRFYASGVRVAVGTDSLASVPDLNLFAELAAMHALAPEVPARRLLDSATRCGAEALGLATEYGEIAPGRRARLVAVDVPPSTVDVEAYLVSGIHPDQIRWLGEAPGGDPDRSDEGEPV